MPSAIDFAFVLLFTVAVMAWEALVFMPRFKARVAAGDPDARMSGYRRTIVGQCLFAAVAILLWTTQHHAWRALGVVPPEGDRRWYGLVIVASIAAFYVTQLRAIRRLPAEQLAALLPRIASLEFILPHRDDEYRRFMALSVTAGICEELLYRGYLMWVLVTYVPLWAAILASAILFGAAHAYQGKTGILKTGGVAIAMNLIVVASGWIVPAMIVHAIVDVAGGTAGYAILRRRTQ